MYAGTRESGANSSAKIDQSMFRRRRESTSNGGEQTAKLSHSTATQHTRFSTSGHVTFTNKHSSHMTSAGSTLGHMERETVYMILVLVKGGGGAKVPF